MSPLRPSQTWHSLKPTIERGCSGSARAGPTAALRRPVRVGFEPDLKVLILQLALVGASCREDETAKPTVSFIARTGSGERVAADQTLSWD